MFLANSVLSHTVQASPAVPEVNYTMPRIHFTTGNIYKIFLNLDTKKATGPDDLPAVVLKNIAVSIPKPLRNLFQLYFSTGVFPTSWKIVNVSPISKKAILQNLKPILTRSVPR
jgi:hypothetical protein